MKGREALSEGREGLTEGLQEGMSDEEKMKGEGKYWVERQKDICRREV